MPIVDIAGAGCRIVSHVVLVAWFACGTGCLATRVHWREPASNRPLHVSTPDSDSSLFRAELVYAAALKAEKECSEECVDLYFEAAALTQCANAIGNCDCPTSRMHKSALTKLIATGEQFGRLDARSGIEVVARGRRQWVPVTHHGFVWDADEFDCLEPVGDYSTNAFRIAHRCCGCGIPLVVTSSCKHPRPFLSDDRIFAATAVMREAEALSDASAATGAGEGSPWAIELYDPLRVNSVQMGQSAVPLAKDISAPIAYRLRDVRRTFLNNFFTPQPAEVQSRLFTLEPYQPGKVPVVFIHGLLSDPFTWVEAINELNATPGFVDHFQLWFFEYPTGDPFLFSAASLRRQLAAAQQTLDPEQANPQFAQMVLVGHSMGGLISKLQATSSGDRLWRSIARVPIEQTVMSPAARERLTNAFFFEPSPLVSRIVFIGTPHQGSADASRLAGRITSLLIVESPQRRETHRQLIENNPNVFSADFTRRVPTSIDLLNPDSELLQTLYTLSLAPCVDAHSIIGNAKWTIGAGPSDGVVPVTSARYPEVESERYIASTHSLLNKDVEAIAELQRILKVHLRDVSRVPTVAAE